MALILLRFIMSSPRKRNYSQVSESRSFCQVFLVFNDLVLLNISETVFVIKQTLYDAKMEEAEVLQTFKVLKKQIDEELMLWFTNLKVIISIITSFAS